MPKNREYFFDLEKYWFRSDARIFYVAFESHGSYAKLVYHYLASLPPGIDASEDRIAKHLGIAPNTVRKAIHRLCHANILKPHKSFRGKNLKARNAYEFVHFSEWEVKSSIETAFKKMNAIQTIESFRDEDEGAIGYGASESSITSGSTGTASDAALIPLPVTEYKPIETNELNELKASVQSTQVSKELEPKDMSWRNLPEARFDLVMGDCSYPASKAISSKQDADEFLTKFRRELNGQLFLQNCPKLLKAYLASGPAIPIAHLESQLSIAFETRFSLTEKTKPEFARGGKFHTQLTDSVFPMIGKLKRDRSKVPTKNAICSARGVYAGVLDTTSDLITYFGEATLPLCRHLVAGLEFCFGLRLSASELLKKDFVVPILNHILASIDELSVEIFYREYLRPVNLHLQSKFRLISRGVLNGESSDEMYCFENMYYFGIGARFTRCSTPNEDDDMECDDNDSDEGESRSQINEKIQSFVNFVVQNPRLLRNEILEIFESHLKIGQAVISGQLNILDEDEVETVAHLKWQTGEILFGKIAS